MRRASFSDMNCSIAQCLEVVGEWWTLLILREAFSGTRRFDEFQRRLGIARNVLADRLDTLVAAGVLERRPYDEARGRYDYRLTAMGLDLWPVLVTLRQWGDRWLVGAGNEPLLLRHEDCGHEMTAQLTCGNCHQSVGPRDVRPVAGPGAAADTGAAL